MNQDPNPYQSPEGLVDNDAGTSADRARLVRGGRLLFIGLFLFYVPLLEIVLPLSTAKEPNGIKIGFALMLFFLMWRGHGWAILLTCLFWGLSAIFLAIAGLQYLTDGIYAAVYLIYIVTALYVVTVLLFIYSKSLNAFFMYQTARRRGTTDGSTPEEDPEQKPGEQDFVTVATFNNPAAANACRYMLEDLNISAFVENGSAAGFNVPISPSMATKLQVPRHDAERAAELIEQAELHTSDNPVKNDAEEVTFDCEECGQKLTFPSFWRGHVRICPHCGGYVDVPE